MSANVDVPYTRRNVSALSQRSNNTNARTPGPINESMVRERLSVNLPNSFHYLNNTSSLVHRRTPQQHRHHHRNSSSSSTNSRDNDGTNALDGSRRVDSSDVDDDSGEGARTRSAARHRGRHASPPHSSRTSSRTSSHRSSSSSSSDGSPNKDGEDDYNFYARFVKLDRSDGDNGTRTSAAAASPTNGGVASLEAQCCDTVRGTIDLLDQVRLSTYDAEHRDKFFWLDLHGVPPPLPGSAEWGKRPRQWQRKRHAALRAATQAAAQGGGGGGRLPEVEMEALWTALGLQETTMKVLTTVCQQRQLNPRPTRSSLDDVYEEEMVDLAFPDDRVLQVEPLVAQSTSEPTVQRPQREEAPVQETPLDRRTAPGQPLTSPAGFTTHLGATHYVMMELATLLTSVPATATSVSAAAWSTTFLSHVGSADFANEPLNDLLWTEKLGRSIHVMPAGYGTASRRGVSRNPRGGGRDSRQLTQSSFYTPQLPVTPLITSTYVLCFPGGCVTWCPGSTLGLTSVARRERRAAAAQERRQRRRQHRRRRQHSEPIEDGGSLSNGSSNGGDSSESSGSDVEEGLELQCVKSWEQLQASVFHRLRHMASRRERDSAAASAANPRGAAGAPALSTSGFVSLLLSAVCYAYLPNTTSLLSEVDVIDSMLPLVGLNVESDQADALRRVLLLRRRLAVHRRLLFQKIRLLEALDKPAMHTIARFVRTVKEATWVTRGARASVYDSTRGTLTSEGHRRDSDMDSLSSHSTPTTYRHGAAAAAAGGAAPTSTTEAAAMVHFVDATNEEAPWSTTTAEQNYGGRSGHYSDVNKDPDVTCFSAADGEMPMGTKGAKSIANRTATPMAEPPSLNAIHRGISTVLRNLEGGRAVLGNTTLIFSSTVNYNNSRTSESSDYFALICQYMVLIVLPLNILASQWGMNCAVPFKYTEGTTPFWSIVGIMIFLAIAGLAVPVFAYRTGRINMIS